MYIVHIRKSYCESPFVCVVIACGDKQAFTYQSYREGAGANRTEIMRVLRHIRTTKTSLTTIFSFWRKLQLSPLLKILLYTLFNLL